ncbi:MAG TPA: hypothetical protein VFW92_07960 [Candidatus Limnocylindrales bacterium]|nr:hypothetical protein [Candidatus Limnocylindrales bacterium]
MRRWSEAAWDVAATRRTSEKVARLAEYLRSLEPDELPIAVGFLAGRPLTGGTGAGGTGAGGSAQVLGLGWSTIAQAVEAVAGADARALARHYDASSDLGQAVRDLLVGSGHHPAAEPLGLREVRATFERAAKARGPEAKRQAFQDLIARADPQEAMALTKIVGGDMRIGLREGHLEAAIAAAFGRELDDVRWAGMLTGDPADVAVLAREDRLAEARLALFRPLTSMLASPAADAGEVVARLGTPVWVEDKYDGIRAQLHRQAGETRLFSRDLNEVSAAFPDVIAAAAELAWDGILDGELLAWRDGAALPFLDLQARLGRKRPPPTLLASTPVIFVAFDLLAWGPGGAAVEPLLRAPLRDRRLRLEGLDLATRPGFGLSRREQAADAVQLDRLFEDARGRGNEGLMVKDPDSQYAPGRRGYGWLKLKRPLATLDCVVVGVEVGHGKRHGVLSDYTFAVIDDRAGTDEGDAASGWGQQLVTVGKAYSGLTDAELAAMTTWFEEHTLERRGRYRVVEPTMVVEVAFDVVQPSRRHASGFALRFPRIVRLRPDKPAAEADRLSTVAALAARSARAAAIEVVTAGERRVS